MLSNDLNIKITEIKNNETDNDEDEDNNVDKKEEN